MLFAIDIFYPFPSQLWLLWVLFWQWVLTCAWLGVVAAFGKRFFHNHSRRIQVATGLNVANLLMWLLGFGIGHNLDVLQKEAGSETARRGAWTFVKPGLVHDTQTRITPCDVPPEIKTIFDSANHLPSVDADPSKALLLTTPFNHRMYQDSHLSQLPSRYRRSHLAWS